MCSVYFGVSNSKHLEINYVTVFVKPVLMQGGRNNKPVCRTPKHAFYRVNFQLRYFSFVLFDLRIKKESLT